MGMLDQPSSDINSGEMGVTTQKEHRSKLEPSLEHIVFSKILYFQKAITQARQRFPSRVFVYKLC